MLEGVISKFANIGKNFMDYLRLSKFTIIDKSPEERYHHSLASSLPSLLSY